MKIKIMESVFFLLPFGLHDKIKKKKTNPLMKEKGDFM